MAQPHLDLDALDAARRAQAREAPTFTLHGVTFECVPELSAMTLMNMGRINQDDPSSAIDAFYQFCDVCIVPEHKQAFWDALNATDEPVSVDQLAKLVEWLTEQYTGRPTGPPSSSPGSPPSDGANSTGGPHSTVSTLPGSRLTGS